MPEYYKLIEPDYRLSVLGEEYTIFLNVPENEDDILTQCDGYCDKTSRRIAICAEPNDCDLDDFTVYRKRILRHEIIHAFMFESGMSACTVWQINGQEHPEQTVDWFAAQFPKLLIAFQTVGAI